MKFEDNGDKSIVSEMRLLAATVNEYSNTDFITVSVLLLYWVHFTDFLKGSCLSVLL